MDGFSFAYHFVTSIHDFAWMSSNSLKKCQYAEIFSVWILAFYKKCRIKTGYIEIYMEILNRISVKIF